MAISRSKRDIGLDLTRIIAFIQVPCIHFLFKIKYYNQAIVGERMYLMTFIRVMFMTCVPLFMKRRDRDPRLRYPQCSRFPEIFVVHRNVHRACAHDPVS